MSPYDLRLFRTGVCLLPLLQPVRLCFQPFLNATDAARVMQTSITITASLLFDYAFVDHVFTFHSAAAVEHSIAFYARYRMRILRMCLSRRWSGSLLDSASGRPLLPASLLALAFGEDSENKTVAHAAFDGREFEPEREEEKEADEEEDGESEFYRRIRPASVDRYHDTVWSVLQYGSCMGPFDKPIPPGSLPQGLRRLQFSEEFNQPLQIGSIPDTVEVLQFGRAFNQPLAVGHLPSSLTHLIVGGLYNQPLLPGVLPAELQQLYFGIRYDQPLQLGTLPSQLQKLSFGQRYTQPIIPGVIPSSVTHVRLGYCYNEPLEVGSIPHGVVHLNLGEWFDRPLLPGMLPTSLRELAIGSQFNQPLLSGSLPEGLELVVFSQYAKFQQTLQPGVIPTTVTVLSMGENYKQEPVTGGMPSTVRWLRLPFDFSNQDLTGALSSATRVLWWERREVVED